MRWRGGYVMVVALLLGSMGVGEARAASRFANSQIEQQWRAGEAIAPNFWGPLANASDGISEDYTGQNVSSGKRLVQYFDKGRMEINDRGDVTNGLLATELTGGRLQMGDAQSVTKDPPAIPIAGDADGGGPTYAALKANGGMLFDARPATLGAEVNIVVDATGNVGGGGVRKDATGPLAITSWDMPTKHNLPHVFVEYRRTAGVLNIGYAISEAFRAQVKLAVSQPMSWYRSSSGVSSPIPRRTRWRFR